jgi:hypothetical protein
MLPFLHGDPDPDLIAYTLDQLDHVMPMGHLFAVILMTVIIMAVPAATIILFAIQERARKEQQNHG